MRSDLAYFMKLHKWHTFCLQMSGLCSGSFPVDTQAGCATRTSSLVHVVAQVKRDFLILYERWIRRFRTNDEECARFQSWLGPMTFN